MSSKQLPRWQRKWFYWTAQTLEPGVAGLEVRVERGGNWTPAHPTTVEPGTGFPRWRLLIAGPDAEVGGADLKVALTGEVWFLSRIVGTEIEGNRSSITVA